MNLIIDVGNTFIKLAVFEKNQLIVKTSTSKENFFEDFERISKEYPALNQVIISAVGVFSEEDLLRIKNKYPTILVSSKTNIPFKNT